MSDKELFYNLITWYESVLAVLQLPIQIYEVKELTIRTYTNEGICNCSLRKFNEDIYDRNGLLDTNKYITTPPIFLKTKESIINSFTIRITKLRKIYETLPNDPNNDYVNQLPDTTEVINLD